VRSYYTLLVTLRILVAAQRKEFERLGLYAYGERLQILLQALTSIHNKNCALRMHWNRFASVDSVGLVIRLTNEIQYLLVALSFSYQKYD
jgi:hypothetical protein